MQQSPRSTTIIAATWILNCLIAGCARPPEIDALAVSDEAPQRAKRVVAIGDLHGDLQATRRAFQLAGAINERDRWIGGEMTVVQLGDMIGRSYEDRAVLDFVFDLREQAESAGGTVIPLIGNHEIFGVRLELRWVEERAFAAFDNLPDLDLSHAALASLPPEQRARSAALMPGGHYARQLAASPVVLKLGGTVFVHGGVTPHWARYGVDKINDDMRRWFRGETDEPHSAKGMDPGHLDDSVVMSRHFSKNVDADACLLLDESLKLLGAQRMVVAHTVQKRIASNCDGKVWAIDAGMSRAYGGKPQVLQILNDTHFSVIGPDLPARENP